MVLSIKIYLEGILGIALFREAHKNDLLVICYRFFCIGIMFHGCTKLFLRKSVSEKMN
jgi:hypothetical protein